MLRRRRSQRLKLFNSENTCACQSQYDGWRLTDTPLPRRQTGYPSSLFRVPCLERNPYRIALLSVRLSVYLRKPFFPGICGDIVLKLISSGVPAEHSHQKNQHTNHRRVQEFRLTPKRPPWQIKLLTSRRGTVRELPEVIAVNKIPKAEIAENVGIIAIREDYTVSLIAGYDWSFLRGR
ncbi:hypothetical protein EVAR_36062_1 [Eumeta japonica]|uniref:Uncharacterized protein n=1 Tax=Eumeta variegata TaxID=151549 RepID=A0A4C1ZFM2_EUMVA|nr:hypothetical protein EVAR_36062_1 [Eumeta japonica]